MTTNNEAAQRLRKWLINEADEHFYKAGVLAALAHERSAGAPLIEVERAIAIVTDSRQTHVNWAEWRRRGNGGDEMAGDLDHHEQAIRDYDHVLSVLARQRRGRPNRRRTRHDLY